MISARRSLAAAAVLLFLSAGAAQAGWMIEEATRGRNVAMEETNWFQNEKIRNETTDQATVMDFSSRRILWIDKKKKTYSSMTFEEFRQILRETLRQADAAMEQMRKAGIAIPGRTDAPRGKVTVSKGAGGTVAGYSCDGYSVSVGGTPTEEVLVTSKIDLASEMGKKTKSEFEELSREFRKMGAAFKPEIDDPAYSAIFEKGYPMKTVDKATNSVHEVVRVKKTQIGKELFEEPADYRKVPFREQFGSPETSGGERRGPAASVSPSDPGRNAADLGNRTTDQPQDAETQAPQEKKGGTMDAIKEGVGGGIKKLFNW